MNGMDERKYSSELQRLSRDYADDVVLAQDYRRKRSELLDAFEAELSVLDQTAGGQLLRLVPLKPRRFPLYGALVGLLVALGVAAALIFWLL